MCPREPGKNEELLCWHSEIVSDFGYRPRSGLVALIIFDLDKLCEIHVQFLRKLLPGEFMLASGEIEQVHKRRARRGCLLRLLFEIFHRRHKATDRNKAIVLQGC